MKKGLTDLHKSVRPFSIDKFSAQLQTTGNLAVNQQWRFLQMLSICYQAKKKHVLLGHFPSSTAGKNGIRINISYSNSIVAGGFEVTSYSTRLTPLTSLTMRTDIRSSTS